MARDIDNERSYLGRVIRQRNLLLADLPFGVGGS